MLTYADETVQQLLSTVNKNRIVPIDDALEGFDIPIDPVARIAQGETAEDESLSAFVGPEAKETVDIMTTSPKEKRQAKKTYKQSTPGSNASFQAAQAATGLGKLTTGQFVRKALAKEGMDYVWGGESLSEGGWDCSGLIVGILRGNGFSGFPRLTAAGLIDHAKPMSVKQAIKTRGAVLWHDGHIAISLGNGKTIEAANTDADIIVGNAHGRFTRGGMLPELTTGKAPQEGSKSKLKNPDAAKVVAAQTGDTLNRSGLSPLVSAQNVFGSVMGETAARPTVVKSPKDWDKDVSAKGLGFVPKKYRNWITEAAQKSGLSPRLIAYVMQKESGFAEDVIRFQRDSSAGARGPMQIMPFWGSTYGQKIFRNPRANVLAGADILAAYINQQGNLRDGLAAYNAGPGNIGAGYGYADDILDLFLARERRAA